MRLAALALTFLAGAALAAEPGAPPPPVGGAAAAAAPAAFDVGDFMSGYARAPAPGRLAEFVVEVVRQRLVNEDTAAPLAAFLGAAFRGSPEAIPAATRAAAGESADAEALAWQGVWLAGTPEAAVQLFLARSERPGVRDALDSLRAQPAPVLLLLPIEGPGVLDMLWSSWLATGEARYVVRVATALAMEKEEDPRRQAAAEAARWSLRANAAQDPRVKRALEEAVAQGGRGADPALVKALLAEEGPVGPPGKKLP